MRKLDHIRLRKRTVHCLHCRDKYTMNLPCLLSVWLAAMKEFCRAHSRCKPKPKAKS